MFRERRGSREKEMGKEDKTKRNLNRIFMEYGKLRDKIMFGGVDHFFNEYSDDYRLGLQETGFEWFDDYDSEEDEEGKAVPLNRNQRFLVEYFEGTSIPSEGVLKAFLKEKHAENPNVPLLRRYFRKGNICLKELLLFGIQECPNDLELLDDIAFFHSFHSMLGDLIAMYMKACRLEQDPETFRMLAEDFYFNTIEDGFDALYELKQEFGSNTLKGTIACELAEGRRWSAD